MLYTVTLSIIKKIYLKELGKISKLCGLLMMKTADKSVCTLENEHISCFACFFVQKILDTCLPSIFLISMRQLPPQHLSEVKIIKGKKNTIRATELCFRTFRFNYQLSFAPAFLCNLEQVPSLYCFPSYTYYV